MTSVDDVKLARDVLTETLHGPVPMHTVARLAEAVIRLDAERQWRPLTADSETWPEEGQAVALIAVERGRTRGGSLVDFDRRCVGVFTHWLPLPDPPPKGESK